MVVLLTIHCLVFCDTIHALTLRIQHIIAVKETSLVKSGVIAGNGKFFK